MTDDLTVWFNPACSKCRATRDLLQACDLDVHYLEYLEETPDRSEIERVLVLLGTDDPRAIIRAGEPVYAELGLDGADRDALLDAMVSHPVLIERPIVIRGDRAVVARPPERVRELLD